MGAVNGYKLAAEYLRECGLDAVAEKRRLTVTLADGRILRGKVKYHPNLPAWLWPCVECEGTGKVRRGNHFCALTQCPACKGSGRRGPQRKLAQWMRDVLEGVRCETCEGTGEDCYIFEGAYYLRAGKRVPALEVYACPDCHGTGWLQHPHNFLMIRKTGGRPKYDWLVLVLYTLPRGEADTAFKQFLYDGVRAGRFIQIPNPRGGDYPPIVVLPAADWARAIGGKSE